VNLRDERPENENVLASDAPASATGLFSLAMEPRPRKSASGEAELLPEGLREKDGAPTFETPDPADSSSGKGNAGAARVQENLPPATAGVVSAGGHAADLTGIFHKVPSEQLEDLPQSSARNSGRGELDPHPATSRQAEEAAEMAAGFTRIFQSLSSSDRGSGEDKRGPYPTEPTQRNSGQPQSSEVRSSPVSPEFHPTRAPGEGEFTRLFRNLKREGSRTSLNEEVLSPNGAAAVSQKGGFTQLLRTLSVEEQEAALPAEEHPAASPYAAGEPVSGEPGEFTRIVSGSLLREAQGRTLPALPLRTLPASFQAAEIAVPSPAPASLAGTPPPSPVSAPILTPEQVVAPPAVVPAAPALPAAPAAGPGNRIQPEPPGNLQRYVPLLLIVNLFVMVLLLIAVVVLLLHR
jgi:hypothetical protein